ncbi:cat eye syndrome critical region protein 1 [Phlyctema vagabunda]|uniref:Cat eye syndrome critical region protein 1 n=1 Tax=Phlyctema vagabunda TaxID=108571 RepID=A0ABR4PKH2_9HELO
MKGLFSYESAFRAYTQECIFNFFHDGITYAEIRPNFMATNSVKTDCGTTSYDNFDIMRIIEEESDAAIAKIRGDGHFFAGIKVIYCHPRVFKPDQVAKALAECLEIKKQFPELLCGFDLVGEEDAGNELHNFTAEFLSFQAACRAADVEIPFLFHCGETLSSGGKVDGNLYDAILLNAKRVGHGYALARHPVLMDLFKQRGMAVECCPISNEVLGLTATAAGHHLSQLLANAVPCTLNSDNGTFYRSSLSHDFYQALVGSEAMSLLGWKQLARWSLEHSCLSPTDRAAAFAAWDRAWLRFLHFVVRTWGPDGAWSERARVVDERVRRPGHVWDPSPRPAASLSLS